MASTQLANMQDGGKVWRKQNLYMAEMQDLVKWDVVDVLKLSGIPKRIIPAKPGISNQTKAVRDQLNQDPYNLFLINELAWIYIQDAHLDKCANVLVRGWKRAGEIEDKDVRFLFLMKLCECSLKLTKYYQADAVLRDIEEPADEKQLRSYLVLACKVYSCRPKGGDLRMALKVFQRAIEGADSALAVRILALTQMDLKKVGGYEAAKAAVEKVASSGQEKAELQMLEHFATQSETAPKNRDAMERNIMIAVAVGFAAFLVYLMYLLEQWSLAKLK